MAASPTRGKQSRGKHILIVTHYAYPHSGGIEQATFNQAKALVALGMRVTIVSSNIPEGPRTETVSGVTFVRISASQILEQGSGVPYTVFSPDLATELEELIPTCDVVHVHGSLYHSTWTAIRIAKKCKKPVVLTEHVGRVPYSNPILQGVQKAAYALAGSKALRAADRVIVLTEEVRQHVAELRKSQEHILLVPNGVDTDFFKPVTLAARKKLRKALAVPEGKKLIAFNGRLIEKKGYQLILDGLTPADYAICIGSGNASEQYTKQSNIRFVGTVPQATVLRILQAADCFVLPSVGEGFPVATMEALACGTPTVLSNTPSNTHYVPNTATVYVERTVASVRDGITAAVKRNTALRKNGRALAVKSMSISQSAKALAALYSEVA